MSTNQLIAKALSTTSEDEAIACLRMARKKGATIETTAPRNKNAANEAETRQMIDMINRFRDRADKFEVLYYDYKGRWADEGYKVKKLQEELVAIRVKIVFIVAFVAATVTLFWLLVGIFAK